MPWKKLPWILVPALLGVAAGSGLGRLAKRLDFSLSRPDALWLLAALPVLGLIVLATHEAGHLIGGRRAGLRPYLLAVGPFLYTWRPARLQFNRHPAFWGGIALALPSNDAGFEDTRRAQLSYIAGGPLASLLLALAAAALAFLLPLPYAVHAGATAVLSAFIVLVTLQPWGAGHGLASDGQRLLALHRGDPEADSSCAFGLLTSLNLSGTRPRDWPASLLERALDAAPASQNRLAALLLWFEHSWDRGDEPAALAALTELEQHAPGAGKFLQDAVTLDRGLWDAAHAAIAPENPHALLAPLEKDRFLTTTGSYAFYRAVLDRLPTANPIR